MKGGGMLAYLDAVERGEVFAFRWRWAEREKVNLVM
jgi:hypothetical protein